MSKGWFIVVVQSGKEDTVKQIVDTRIKSGSMSFISDFFIPKHKEIVFKDGKKKTVEKRSFPGYVYVNMEMNNETLGKVVDLPYVLGFVKNAGQDLPLPLPESEYMGVIAGREEGSEESEISMAYMEFDVGQKVVVIDGPFNGFSGSIKEIYEDKKKLIVSVEIFGRMTPVEIDYFKVKRV